MTTPNRYVPRHAGETPQAAECSQVAREAIDYRRAFTLLNAVDGPTATRLHLALSRHWLTVTQARHRIAA